MELTREDGRPVEALLRLANRHGITTTDQMTAKELSDAVQENWIRKTEHQYQIPEGPPAPEDMSLLEDLWLIGARTAPPGHFDGALILGGTVTAVRKRLGFLAEQHRQGMTVTTVYLLGGARPLDKDKESPTALCTQAELPFKEDWAAPSTLPTTEAEMMKLVFDQSLLPKEWQDVLINAPLQTTADGKTRHPNTTDTLVELRKTNPRPGTYLVVSSQPYVTRQTINAQQALPESADVGIGYAAPQTTALKGFLDEVARLLYEEVALAEASTAPSSPAPLPTGGSDANAPAAPAPEAPPAATANPPETILTETKRIAEEAASNAQQATLQRIATLEDAVAGLRADVQKKWEDLPNLFAAAVTASSPSSPTPSKAPDAPLPAAPMPAPAPASLTPPEARPPIRQEPASDELSWRTLGIVAAVFVLFILGGSYAVIEYLL